MLYPPLTKEEATKYKYHGRVSNPVSSVYQPGRCAFEVFEMGSGRQCNRRSGHGPDNLYCKQHAAEVISGMGHVSYPRGLLDIKEGIVCHQANCFCRHGAGLAAILCHEYPRLKADLEEWGNKFPPRSLLGKALFTTVHDGLIIASVFGQFHYGRRDKVYTKYDAVDQAFHTITDMRQGRDVFIPYLMGCDLAGGDWNLYIDRVQRHIPDVLVVHRLAS